MKLYDGGRAPNPRRTRIFLAEKNIQLPMEQVDLGAMQHRSPAYAAVNPLMTIREKSDAGLPVVATEPDGPHAKIYRDIAAKVRDQLKGGAGRAAPKIVIEA